MLRGAVCSRRVKKPMQGPPPPPPRPGDPRPHPSPIPYSHPHLVDVDSINLWLTHSMHSQEDCQNVKKASYWLSRELDKKRKIKQTNNINIDQ